MSVCFQELNHYEHKRLGSRARAEYIRGGQIRLLAKDIDIVRNDENKIIVTYRVKRDHYEEILPYLPLSDIPVLENMTNEEMAVYHPDYYWNIVNHEKSIKDFVAHGAKRKLEF